ncbi:putative UV excision repair protein [Gregarina niphandrodes]|uniref:UV excision repair protein RAD23 n=1 Tax=Gregarina niphandrodes TaxID=110365 RepID=A0A023BAK1_GRENI|nr:putative UV excision repair protein [Gregarina niphandrodes]EZG78253.1 putative UV excision repair protein [Gregarina niphandrodes]|eukprot:XP_011129378.1 putative UV excision repair protein [Gregarina niphandrodes]
MKLAVQTVQSVVKEIEIDGQQTFDDLRNEISKAYNWPANAKVVLVHNSRILSQTTEALSTYPNLKDGDKLAVMKRTVASAPKPVTPAGVAPVGITPAAVAPVVAAPAAAAATPAAAASAEAGAAPAPEASSSAPAPSDAPAPSSAPFGSAFQNSEMVAMITDMGFEREKVQQALVAAFGDPDRAVDYLMNGIPANVARDMAAAAAPVADPARLAALAAASGNAGSGPAVPGTTAAATTAPPTTGSGMAPGTAAGGLQTEAFGSMPMGGGASAPPTAAPTAEPTAEQSQNLMAQLSQLAAADPSILPHILRAMGEQNPGMLQFIEQNPQVFSQALASMAAQGAEGPGLERDPPGVITVQLSQAEMDAVGRLCELGFSRDLVVQAYLACDKNEELAANLLFNSLDADDAP